MRSRARFCRSVLKSKYKATRRGWLYAACSSPTPTVRTAVEFPLLPSTLHPRTLMLTLPRHSLVCGKPQQRSRCQQRQWPQLPQLRRSCNSNSNSNYQPTSQMPRLEMQSQNHLPLSHTHLGYFVRASQLEAMCTVTRSRLLTPSLPAAVFLITPGYQNPIQLPLTAILSRNKNANA